MANQQILLKVWTYLTPTILLVGTVGNVLSLIAVSNRNCRKSSFTTYIASLAVVDTVVLYANLIPYWLNHAFSIVLENTNQISCKLVYFLKTFARQLASWLVSAMTVERTFCTFFPHKINIVCHSKTGFKVTGTFVVVLSALNAHIFYGFQISSVHNVTACMFADNIYGYFIVYYYTWIDFGVYFLCPVICIIIANSATVCKVYRTNKLLAISVVSDTNRTKRTRHLLIITLLVSITFVLCLFPASLYHAILPYLTDASTEAHPQSSNADIIWTSLYYWQMINHAVNFFLYVLSGQRFRRDLKNAFSPSTTTETYMG